MLRTLFWLSWMFIYMFCRLPLFLKMQRLEKQGKTLEKQEIIDREVAIWAQKLLSHIKLNVSVSGEENLPKKGQVVVFAANHQSYLDIPILLANIAPPPPLLAKKELGDIPLFGFWMRQLGCVFVKRSDARSGMDAMKDAQSAVENGRCMVVFPEGTRSKGEEMAEFQAGVVRIALRAKVPIVPIAICGSYKGFEGNKNRLKKAHVQLVVLPQINTAQMDRARQRALPEQLANDISAAKNAAGGVPGVG